MRSENTKAKDNCLKLLAEFQSKGKLTTEDIMQLLDCNRQSVNNYLKRLTEDGYTVSRLKGQKPPYYVLETTEDANPALSYKTLTMNDLRKYALIQVLQKSHVKKSEFESCFVLKEKNNKDKSHFSEKVALDIASTAFDNLHNSLVASGEIIVHPDTKKYYLGAKEIPFCLSLKESELMYLNSRLTTVSNASPYHEQILSLNRKVQALLGSFDADTAYLDQYLIYGKKFSGFAANVTHLELITKRDFRGKVLHISYKAKNNQISDFLFSIGLIIYCVEKDKFYIFGNKLSEEGKLLSELPQILLAESVQSVEETDIINNSYQSKQFMDIFYTMFSVSTEPPVRVEVEFEDALNIRQKFEKLANQRKTADIKPSDHEGYFKYTDTIRGLDDFAAFLRTLGSSVRVLEPSNLREQLYTSVKTSLQKYEEVEHGLR